MFPQATISWVVIGRDIKAAFIETEKEKLTDVRPGTKLSQLLLNVDNEMMLTDCKVKANV